MPTNRQRRTRAPRQVVPAWAETLLRTGRRPARDDPGYRQFLGWLYFDGKVPGLRPEHEIRKEISLYGSAGTG
ncbi:MAG: hypothetical protein ABR533_12290 [Desulfonatronovibrio sp.]